MTRNEIRLASGAAARWFKLTKAALFTLALAAAMGPQALPAQLFHPANGTPPSFDVATIKPNGDPRAGLNFALSVTNFRATNATLHDLVKLAYNVRSEDQVVGLSGWMTTRHFDIRAKASDADIAAFQNLSFEKKLDEVRWMLQTLLADRFALKVSFTQKDLPVYALVVAKGGPKMKEVEMSPFPPPGTPAPPGAHLPRIGPTGPNQYTASAWSMDQMADWLSFFDEIGNRVVVNETGLKGYYDFVLNGVSQHFPASANFNGAAAPEPAASIFAALPEQLGLRMEPKKAPVEVLAIDHVEEPTAN
jgi:uncharacterized protein (TIGR03435 family)